MLVILFEVHISAASLVESEHTSPSVEVEFRVWLVVAQKLVVFAFEAKCYDLLGSVVHLLSKESEVFSDHLESFSQHCVERLLLSELQCLEWADLADICQNHSPYRILGDGCFSEQMLC